MSSLYEFTIPVFVRAFRNLDHVLAKAAESGIDEAALIEARLAADMHPLPKQVQIASDTARFAAVRLGLAEPLAMADEEKTIAELRARVAATIAYLEAVDPAPFKGRKKAEVVVNFPNGAMTFTGLTYATDFALPNFFFHVTTTYALLRMKGVALGKMDYLAGGSTSA